MAVRASMIYLPLIALGLFVDIECIVLPGKCKVIKRRDLLQNFADRICFAELSDEIHFLNIFVGIHNVNPVQLFQLLKDLREGLVVEHIPGSFFTGRNRRLIGFYCMVCAFVAPYAVVNR